MKPTTNQKLKEHFHTVSNISFFASDNLMAAKCQT